MLCSVVLSSCGLLLLLLSSSLAQPQADSLDSSTRSSSILKGQFKTSKELEHVISQVSPVTVSSICLLHCLEEGCSVGNFFTLVGKGTVLPMSAQLTLPRNVDIKTPLYVVQGDGSLLSAYGGSHLLTIPLAVLQYALRIHIDAKMDGSLFIRLENRTTVVVESHSQIQVEPCCKQYSYLMDSDGPFFKDHVPVGKQVFNYMCVVLLICSLLHFAILLLTCPQVFLFCLFLFGALCFLSLLVVFQ